MWTNLTSEGEVWKKELKVGMNGFMPAAFSESVRCCWVTLALLKEAVTQYSPKRKRPSFSLSFSHYSIWYELSLSLLYFFLNFFLLLFLFGGFFSFFTLCYGMGERGCVFWGSIKSSFQWDLSWSHIKMGALYPLLFYFTRLLRAEAAEQWCSCCCNAETVGFDVWQKERERCKQTWLQEQRL